jgi:hypothetical protein
VSCLDSIRFYVLRNKPTCISLVTSDFEYVNHQLNRCRVNDFCSENHFWEPKLNVLLYVLRSLKQYSMTLHKLHNVNGRIENDELAKMWKVNKLGKKTKRKELRYIIPFAYKRQSTTKNFRDDRRHPCWLELHNQ